MCNYNKNCCSGLLGFLFGGLCLGCSNSNCNLRNGYDAYYAAQYGLNDEINRNNGCSFCSRCISCNSSNSSNIRNNCCS